MLGRPGGFVQVELLPPPAEPPSMLSEVANWLYDTVVGFLPQSEKLPLYREQPIQRVSTITTRRAPRSTAKPRGRAASRRGRDGAVGRRAGAALQAGDRRLDAVDHGCGDRALDPLGALRHPESVGDGAGGDGAAVALSRRHDRAADPPFGDGGRAGTARPRHRPGAQAQCRRQAGDPSISAGAATKSAISPWRSTK